MTLVKKLMLNEEGSPTVESVFWIVIFVGIMIMAVTVFANKIADALELNGDNIIAKSYDMYCASLNKIDATSGKPLDFWTGSLDASGNPTCQVSPR